MKLSLSLAVFLRLNLSARYNTTHKYFSGSHMLGNAAHESVHTKAESIIAKKRRMRTKIHIVTRFYERNLKLLKRVKRNAFFLVCFAFCIIYIQCMYICIWRNSHLTFQP